MATIQKIEKSIQLTAPSGKPIQGMYRPILIWAVLSDNMRDTLYEAAGAMPTHLRECQAWLANHMRKCETCEE